MKTNLIFIFSITILASSGLFGQATVQGNSGSNPATQFLGWDAATSFDLNIKHEANLNIIFSTNNLERMRLTNDGRLLIGLTASTNNARLEVLDNSTNGLAVRGRATGASTVNVGGQFTAIAGPIAIGAQGSANLLAPQRNYGVYGEACNAPTNYAIYGLGCEEPNSWAGYFDGKTFCTSQMWDASDASLKTNIEALANASDMLMALQPKSYHFVDDADFINLPQGMQYGFLAHEMAEVVPHAVTEVSTPDRMDDDGNIMVEGQTIQGVNYTQLIPLLVAGFQEQSSTAAKNQESIEQLYTRLAMVEMEVARLVDGEALPQSSQGSKLNGAEKFSLHHAVPNPFETQTQVKYTLDTPGQVKIEVVDAQGRKVAQLVNATADQGEYTATWDASAVGSGIYYIIMRQGAEVKATKVIKR